LVCKYNFRISDQLRTVHQGQRVKVEVTEAKQREIPPFLTEMAQSRCKCSDGKSISVIHGMTPPACSNDGRRGQKYADGRMSGIQISDTQTDRVGLMTERVCIVFGGLLPSIRTL